MIWFFAALCVAGLVLGGIARAPALLLANGVALVLAAGCAAELGWRFWPALGAVVLSPFVLDAAYLAGLALSGRARHPGAGRVASHPRQPQSAEHRRTERVESERTMLAPDLRAGAVQTLPSCLSSTGMVRRTIFASLRRDHP